MPQHHLSPTDSPLAVAESCPTKASEVAAALGSSALVVTPRNSSGLLLTPDVIHAAVVPLGARGDSAYPLANITLQTLKVGAPDAQSPLSVTQSPLSVAQAPLFVIP